MSGLRKIVAASVSVVLSGVLALSANAQNNPHQRPLGDSHIFAPFPASPGFPEGIAIEDDRLYVSGPAQFGLFDTPKVVVYDLETGAKLQEIEIQGLNQFAPKALSGIAFGKQDMLYVIEAIQLGVVRFDVDTPHTQEIYSPLMPNLPTCAAAAPGAPCSPTAVDNPPLPNDLVFDKNGYGYVSDSLQATIWRIPPGGGAAQIWFQDARLDSPSLGVNGLRIDGNKLYLAQTVNNTGEGAIYTLPLNNPTAANLNLFHRYAPAPGICAPNDNKCSVGIGPDGIVFGKSGKLYVSLAITSQVSVLSANGAQQAIYAGPATNPSNPSDVLLWANPSNMVFNNETRSLLVCNHAIFAPNPAPLFGLFDVFVNDKGAQLFRPHQ